MDYIAIHKKWDQYWKEHNTNKYDPKSKKPKYYCLEMFPYPSGANLHLGHYFNFALSDTHARFKRMTGFEVFQPFGFDAFGLPAENFALKTGTRPRDNTLKNIDKMRAQINEVGYMTDWNYEVTTCFPDYYKWTQWLFVQLFNAGLAYQKNALVNFCTKCNTVLANEQVTDGECERCGSTVIRKQMNQWFLKITDFAEDLLDGLDGLDWPEKTKIMQRNWIGKSVGANVKWPLANGGGEIETFTTRIDTIFGATFLVVAPEHPIIDKITTPENKKKINDYIKKAASKSDVERMGDQSEKTGAFTGSYVINPATKEQIPVYVADYVIYTYGTGAVQGCPAHDERDFDFARKYKIEIRYVIHEKGKPVDSADTATCCGHDGLDNFVLYNSKQFDGLTSEQALTKIVEWLAKDKLAEFKTTYRLRDWGIGRQRYWGCPIPIIFCEKCGAVAETRLPVLLPDIDDFSPKGAAPLASHPEFYNSTCPNCNKPAVRECDTMDTFMCSSWYFLRYPDARNDKEPFNKETANTMLPVDKYIGGAEHACMHLLYARFITMFLQKQGFINFKEPFKSLVHQGMILGPDGQKMSKSKGNTKEPDTYTNQYGSDILRLFMLFGFNYIEGGPWNDNTLKTVTRFTERIESLIKQFTENNEKYKANDKEDLTQADKDLLYAEHYAIKHVRDDLEKFSFNTAVARCMEHLNAINAYIISDEIKACVWGGTLKTLTLLIAPMVPHIAEEYWELLGEKTSVFDVSYPEVETKWLTKDTIEIAAQINSKIITRLNIPNGAEQKAVEKLCLADEKIKTVLGGKEVKKVIYIPNKLINFII